MGVKWHRIAILVHREKMCKNLWEKVIKEERRKLAFIAAIAGIYGTFPCFMFHVFHGCREGGGRKEACGRCRHGYQGNHGAAALIMLHTHSAPGSASRASSPRGGSQECWLAQD